MTAAAPLSPEQRLWRVRILTATWLSYAGYYFCRKAFGIVKAPIKAALAVDDYQLAHLFTAYLVAYMLGQFLAGWWGTKVATRRLLLTGMALARLSCSRANRT